MNQIVIGAASDPGKKRKENQDAHAYFSPPEGTDHKKGHFAGIGRRHGGSCRRVHRLQTGVDTLIETYYDNAGGSIPESLKRSFLAANQKVIERSRGDRTVQGLGSTLTAVVFQGSEMYHAHVGDSRGYSIFANRITRFTEDHSYVASLVKAGAITPEEARSHPEGNIITRAIGFKDDLKVDTSPTPEKIHKDQFVLLCCDGLYKEVSDQEILTTVYDLKTRKPSAKN
jgi:protein phosphatase